MAYLGPILTNFGYFVANLRAFGVLVSGLLQAVYQNDKYHVCRADQALKTNHHQAIERPSYTFLTMAEKSSC